jgi:hypothetical protein
MSEFTHSNERLVMPDGMTGDIDAHYATHIQPFCEVFEQRRQVAISASEKRKPFAIAGYVAGIALVIGSHYFPPQDPSEDISLVVKVIVIATISLFIRFWHTSPKDAYEESIKEEIFPRIFSFFGDDYIYSPSAEGVAVKDLKSFGIVPRFNHNGDSNEDLVRGSYKGVSVQLFESKLERSGNTSRETVFSGLFITLSMHKKFRGHTVVKRDGGKLGNFLNDKTTKLEHVKLEDPTFEKMFEIYSSDQVEARYLLTPAFMERLIHLEAIFLGQDNEDSKIRKSNLQAAFYDRHLLLMIPSDTNRFEVRGINERVTFYEEINTVLAEMQDIFGIVEHLKLHENTRL